MRPYGEFMVYFVYCSETASTNIAGALKRALDLREVNNFHGLHCFENKDVKMIDIKDPLIHAESLDGILDGLVVFLSRHTSTKGIPAFTVHSEGNWTEDVTLGGRPKELSVCSPVNMLKVISAINSVNKTDIQVTYEATHHGPFTNCPSFFVELGGNTETINSKNHAELIADALAKSLDMDVNYDKIAIGIGGMHYSDKFTKLALSGKYAFAHIMPKYQVKNVDMLDKAFSRSDRKPELAVIEWKSIKAVDRETITRELNVLGIDYAKV